MNNLELQKKAESFVKEKKWDLHLMNLFLNTQHFSSWMNRDDFDDYNFGLKDISLKDKEIELKNSKKNLQFLKASFNDINFMIGGDFDSFILPDDSYCATQTVILCLEEEIVMNVRYESPNSDYSSLASEYKIRSVEEFHNHVLLHELLLQTYLANKQKIIQRNNKFNSERNKSYKDKFTFD